MTPATLPAGLVLRLAGDILAACIAAMHADEPRREARREDERRQEAARREQEYTESVMATVPHGRISFDAEAAFRVQDN